MLTTINPLVNGDNLIINPCMRWWQRGITFNSSGAYNTFFRGYTADRWHVSSYSGTNEVTRQDLINLTDLPTDETPRSQHYLRYSGTDGGLEYDLLQQPIQLTTNGHQAFVGQWITFSFWAKTNSGNPTMWVCLRRMFNETNWADGGTDVPFKQSFTLSTSWQKFTFTFKMPAVVGSPGSIINPVLRLEFLKRISGTTATNYVITPFDSSSFDLDLTNVKLEFGQEATPLVYDEKTDFFKCLRYFQKSLNNDVAVGTASGGNGAFLIDINGNNSALVTSSSIFYTPLRNGLNNNIGGTPANSRVRGWNQTSTTIDRTYAQTDGSARTITNYDCSPTGNIIVTVTGAVSTYHQMHFAVCGEFWF